MKQEIYVIIFFVVLILNSGYRLFKRYWKKIEKLKKAGK